jgi:sodium/potassium-transporting ATPase subunit alpha
LIFKNLKKSIQYTICHTLPEVFSGLLYVVVPLPLPITALQLIFIDLGFEMFVALSYAWDPPESRRGLMNAPPRQQVNEQTIRMIRLKRQLREELERGRPIPMDSCTVFSRMLNLLKNLWFDVRKVFKRSFWKLHFHNSYGEELVDANVFSYAYLEIGMLEAVGAFLCFFSTMYYVYGMTPAVMRDIALSPENYLSPEARVNLQFESLKDVSHA